MVEQALDMPETSVLFAQEDGKGVARGMVAGLSDFACFLLLKVVSKGLAISMSFSC